MLHVAPESFLGGPLALVQTGDEIEINIPLRTIHWHVDEVEIARRMANWTPPEPKFERGYGQLYSKHVTQANQGCDFDFLAGRTPGAEPGIH